VIEILKRRMKMAEGVCVEKMKERRVGKNMQKESDEIENEEIKMNCCNTILIQTDLYF